MSGLSRTAPETLMAAARPTADARAVWMACGVFAVYLFTTPWSTLWDRDEPRFARATLEMIDSGNYLVPTFRGEIRSQKPILSYWLMSLSARAFGPNAFGARFWSPFAAALACYFTYLAGKALFSPAAGLWAMAVLATTPLLLVEGTAATADALLLAGITGALAVAARSLRQGLTLRGAAALAACLAAAQLAKGPLGLLLPLLAFGLTWLLRRKRVSPRELAPAGGAALLSILVFVAWFLPADAASGGAFLGEGMMLLRRGVQPMESHGGHWLLSLPYYLPILLVGFSPWIALLPAAISAAIGKRLGGIEGRALLVGWSLPVFVVMTAAATKLPHYVLPAWPALGLAVGATLDAARAGGLAERDRSWMRRGLWLLVFLLALGSLVFLAAAALGPPPVRLPAALLGLAIAGLAAAVLPRYAAGRYTSAGAILAGGIGAIQLVGPPLLLPALETFKPVPRLASAIRARVPPGVPVYTLGFDEPSLDFYLFPSRLRSLPRESGLDAWREVPGPSVLVSTRRALERFPKEGSDGTEPIAVERGLNYSKGDWVDLVAIGRNLSRSDR